MLRHPSRLRVLPLSRQTGTHTTLDWDEGTTQANCFEWNCASGGFSPMKDESKIGYAYGDVTQ